RDVELEAGAMELELEDEALEAGELGLGEEGGDGVDGVEPGAARVEPIGREAGGGAGDRSCGDAGERGVVEDGAGVVELTQAQAVLLEQARVDGEEHVEDARAGAEADPAVVTCLVEQLKELRLLEREGGVELALARERELERAGARR